MTSRVFTRDADGGSRRCGRYLAPILVPRRFRAYVRNPEEVQIVARSGVSSSSMAAWYPAHSASRPGRFVGRMTRIRVVFDTRDRTRIASSRPRVAPVVHFPFKCFDSEHNTLRRREVRGRLLLCLLNGKDRVLAIGQSMPVALPVSDRCIGRETGFQS